jgi:hypothetical protein
MPVTVVRLTRSRDAAGEVVARLGVPGMYCPDLARHLEERLDFVHELAQRVGGDRCGMTEPGGAATGRE